ncbi:YceD family protein [Geodermatophilus sp. SYSU D00691]
MQPFEKVLPAPDGWKVELIGVPGGAEVRLRLRLESVMEGVLVSGEVDVPVVGSCARCLDPVEDTLELDVQELFAYEGSTTEETSEEDEVRLVENDRIDLEPMVRDLVVLSLPLSPVCSEDCSGLCADCGQRLDDLPADHSHEVVDPRWAGLADRFASPSGTPGADNPEEN